MGVASGLELLGQPSGTLGVVACTAGGGVRPTTPSARIKLAKTISNLCFSVSILLVLYLRFCNWASNATQVSFDSYHANGYYSQVEGLASKYK